MFEDSFFEYLLYTMGVFLFLMFLVLGGLCGGPYLILRQRDRRNGSRDRQLGLKVALHFLMSLSLAFAWLGMTFIVISVVMEMEPDLLQHIGSGIGFCIAGLLLALFLHRLIRSTNDHQFPASRKAYVTLRLVCSGFMFVTCFTMSVSRLLELIIAPGAGWTGYGFGFSGSSPSQWDGMKQYLAAAGIWFIACAIDYLLLQRVIRRPDLPPFEDLCLKCDYPLTATILSKGKSCPECGSEILADQNRIITLRQEHRQQQADRESIAAERKS